MDKINEFIREVYGFSEDSLPVKHAVDSYIIEEKDYKYFLLLTPSQQELAALQAVISYLNNNKIIKEEIVQSISGSDFVTFESKFCSLFKTEVFDELKKYSLTKVRLQELINLIIRVVNGSRYLSELFKSKEQFIVTNIEEKIVRQLEKAKDFFNENGTIKVSSYDSVKINFDLLDLLISNIHTLIEKLNTDISRQAINFNIDNSFYIDEFKEVQVVITDKIFLGDPIFLFSKLAAKTYELESGFDEDELVEIIFKEYEKFIPNHFTHEYFEVVKDAYLLISLYKNAKHILDVDIEPNFMDVARGLSYSKIVEWI